MITTSLTQKYALIECLREFRHELRKQHSDFNRRGFSNRNGANNRTERKHLNNKSNENRNI